VQVFVKQLNQAIVDRSGVVVEQMSSEKALFDVAVSWRGSESGWRVVTIKGEQL
jgi:hypothetical protein